jgi:hypothetical protein
MHTYTQNLKIFEKEISLFKSNSTSESESKNYFSHSNGLFMLTVSIQHINSKYEWYLKSTIMKIIENTCKSADI